MAGSAMTQISAITSMNLRNVSRAPDLFGRRAGRHRGRRHGAHRRAVDQRRFPRRARRCPVARDVAIVLRSGATDEMGSGLTQEQTRIIADAKDIARDAQGAIASPELYVIVDVPLKRTVTAANVPLRGVGPQAPQLRQNFRIVEGRNFTPGTFEIIVGRGASQQFAGLTVGNKLRWGTTDWTVVGIFEDRGSVAESEDLDRRHGAAGRLQPRHHLSVDARQAHQPGRVPVVQGRAHHRPAAQRADVHREASTTSSSRGRCIDAGQHDRRDDRGADGPRRGVRRAQHDVLGGLDPHARDRDAARARLRLRAGRRSRC